jgi:hypothetical protein
MTVGRRVRDVEAESLDGETRLVLSRLAAALRATASTQDPRTGALCWCDDESPCNAMPTNGYGPSDAKCSEARAVLALAYELSQRGRPWRLDLGTLESYGTNGNLLTWVRWSE